MAGSREARAIAVAALLVAVGVVMVRLGFGSFELRSAILALLTGWIMGASGLRAWIREPSSRTGLLLVAAAAAWYLANLQRTSIPLLDDVAGVLRLAYAAILVHAILAFPSGHLRSSLSSMLILAAYSTSLLPSPAGGILIAVLVAIGVVSGLLARVRAHAPPGWPPLVGLPFALVLGAASALPWVVSGGSALDTRPALEVAMAIVAVSLSASIVIASERLQRVTDLVVELGGAGVGGLAGPLAVAIGDPTLEVGFWLADQNRYVDPTGREIVLPAPGSGRGMTPIDRAGRPVAVLIHDAETTADPGVRSSIARAADLSGANARLQAEVQTQLVDVAASRRRLLEAADEERRVLRTRLDEDLGTLFTDLEAALVDAGLGSDCPASTAGPVVQLRETRREMAEIANGLHPGALDTLGLAGALRALAGRSRVPVRMQIDTSIDGTPASQAALYFVCSETLTNAAKHAGATSISVRLTQSDGNLLLTIEDDGIGGADPRRGTGLLGLRDRLEALGGTLSIASRASHGTRVVAAVPAGQGSAPPPTEGNGAVRGQRRVT
jgi:signal transduction histidine kinase